MEAEIMDVLWSINGGRVADVCSALGADANYKTVMTVMARLVDKRLLRRHRDRRAYVYCPVETREAFLERVSRCVAEGLVRDFGGVAVAQFVDAVDTVDPALLTQLRALLTARSATEVP
jgi:predicted transcriptional regulator